MTGTTQPLLLPRYKIGYYSDEQGMRSSTPTGIPDPEGTWVRFEHAQTLIAHAQRRHEAELAAIGAGGVSGPLLGQPQAMPDLSQLTERGAKVWAGVDAQALRDGTQAPPVRDTLRAAAQAVVDRWDTPLWKDVPATAEYIGRLRAALAAQAPVTDLQNVHDAVTVDLLNERVAYLEAKLKEAQAPQPGYVLVPVEPTTDQEWAGKQAALRGSTMAEACKIYKAMIAAATKAPQQEVQEPAFWTRQRFGEEREFCEKPFTTDWTPLYTAQPAPQQELCQSCRYGDIYACTCAHKGQPAPSGDAEDSARLDWLLLHISGAEFRRIGVHYSGNARRADVDAARKEGK